VEEELPIDQSIFLDISGFSSEEAFFWLFKAEGDSGEDVGDNTDQAGKGKEIRSQSCTSSQKDRLMLTSSGWRKALAVDPKRRSTGWASIPRTIRQVGGR